MSKKKVKSKRKSELNIIFFIILVAAALFVISTYAWFSTQKNVSITNLSGLVEVAEGLEISLDAEHWANEIVLSDETTIINSAYEGHRNISPKEMLPVSTLGRVEAKAKDLKMYRGTLNNSIELSKIYEMQESLALSTNQEEHDTENSKYPGYFAFDIFLKNSSKQTDTNDPLQLNYDSSLYIIEDGNDTVGLQNTVRVALAKYGTGEKDSGGGTYDGGNPIRDGVADVMADQETILKRTGCDGVDGAAEDVYITDVAMWEPNSSDHVEYVVNNNNKITWGDSDGSKYGTWQDVTGSPNGKNGYYKFTTTQKMPTYALKNNISSETKINDIYRWDGTETNLEKQLALQTTNTRNSDTDEVNYEIAEGVQNLFSTTDGTSKFEIAPNSIVRLRVYVWLEGQDIDCINYASHGGGVTLNLGLVKGSREGSKATDVTE